MEIDLCVFLAGNNLEAYAPIFFETLYRNCDLSFVNIHVVEKGTFNPGVPIENGTYTPDIKDYTPGVGDKVHNYLLEKQKERLMPFTIYEKHDPSEFFQSTTPREPCYELSADHANTLNWAIENCGTNKWVLFCHSDVVFTGDVISYFKSEMNDHTGMFGLFVCCVAVNREAYRKVGIQFNAISAFYAVPATNYGTGHIVRHINDPECNVRTMPLWGWDTGELLELIMLANGWRCSVRNNPNVLSYIYHAGSGHGYLRNQVQVSHINERLNSILGQLNIQRL